ADRCAERPAPPRAARGLPRAAPLPPVRRHPGEGGARARACPADLHGPRRGGSAHPARACRAVARPPHRPRLPRRVARVPDAALRLRRGNLRDQPLALHRSALDDAAGFRDSPVDQEWARGYRTYRRLVATGRKPIALYMCCGVSEASATMTTAPAPWARQSATQWWMSAAARAR